VVYFMVILGQSGTLQMCRPLFWATNLSLVSSDCPSHCSEADEGDGARGGRSWAWTQSHLCPLNEWIMNASLKQRN
jgi:hypothetical protein